MCLLDDFFSPLSPTFFDFLLKLKGFPYMYNTEYKRYTLLSRGTEVYEYVSPL